MRIFKYAFKDAHWMRIRCAFKDAHLCRAAKMRILVSGVLGHLKIVVFPNFYIYSLVKLSVLDKDNTVI